MSIALRLLVLVLAVAGLVGGGYRWGDHARDNAWKAKESKRLQAEASAREDELRRGEKASGALGLELRDQAIANDQLTRAFNVLQKRTSILAASPAAPAVLAAYPSTPADAGTATAAAQDCGARAGGAEPGISVGAVWMWNSALISGDRPEGACGLSDLSEGACAADSGVSLDEAWDNHALNARLCAEDRLRHRALIEFIKSKKTPMSKGNEP